MNDKNIFVLTIKISFLHNQETKMDYKHALGFE